MWEENLKFKTFRMLYFKEIIVLEEVTEASAEFSKASARERSPTEQ